MRPSQDTQCVGDEVVMWSLHGYVDLLENEVTARRGGRFLRLNDTSIP